MAIGIIIGIIIALIGIGSLIGANIALNESYNFKTGLCLILVIVSVIAFIVVPFSFYTVDTGKIVVVKHLGKIKDVRESGTYYDFWLTNKRVKYDSKVQELHIEDMAYSSDAQQMTLQTKFQYQIKPDKVKNITESYGSLKSLETRIGAIISEKTKSVLSGYTAMDIIANRAAISPSVEKVVKDSLGEEYYINVTNLSLTNIDFSDAFETAVEEKMIAEQQQLKTKYEAEAKIIAAEAEAKSNELLERSLTDKILKEMYIDKWDGKLPQVVSDGSTMIQLPTMQ